MTPPKHDLTAELYREYDLGTRVYHIDEPVALWAGETTHRVQDAKGMVHCPPAPRPAKNGDMGVVLRWMPRDPKNPVQF